jgi:hypothetical protein
MEEAHNGRGAVVESEMAKSSSVQVQTRKNSHTGIATSRRHSLPTQPISREEERTWVIG